MAFVPFSYREDVVLTYQQPGVFGFAIPLDLLVPLGTLIDVTDEAGVILANGKSVSLPLTGAGARARSPLHVFLHIPKTAGTSLRNALLRTVPPGEFLLIYPDMPGLSLERAHQIPLRQRNRLQWVYGHLKFGFDRLVTRSCRYFTFVREPLDRLRSNFRHHAAAGTQFEVDGRPVRPSTVLNEGLSEEFDNLMTRFLTGFGVDIVPLGHIGEDDVELALKNVREHFYFVGLHSQASRDLTRLQTNLGLPPQPLPFDNVTPPSNCYDEAEFGHIKWDRVAARNAPDATLYKRLMQEGLVSRVLAV